ncbi:uncharacterized protein Dana_GF21491 [Drosophila ananassae]|uniref:Uncharacterized protein n=1 Tax=Drosophila ananassae TaxID=7217 RepID=B3MSL1_DROAN|nr:titin [Drosophila ananassae]EDV34766.2 uncharacterized protein Dana_GF21491 [Drosophila ananassae]
MNDTGGESCSNEPLTKELVGKETPTPLAEAVMTVALNELNENAAFNNDLNPQNAAATSGVPVPVPVTEEKIIPQEGEELVPSTDESEVIPKDPVTPNDLDPTGPSVAAVATIENTFKNEQTTDVTTDSNKMDPIPKTDADVPEENEDIMVPVVVPEEAPVPEEPLPVVVEVPPVAPEPLVPSVERSKTPDPIQTAPERLQIPESLLPPDSFGSGLFGVSQPFGASEPFLPPEPLMPAGAFVNPGPFGQSEPFVAPGAFVPPEAFDLPDGFLSPASLIRPESPLPWRGPSLHNPFSLFNTAVEFDHDGYVLLAQPVPHSEPPIRVTDFDEEDDYLYPIPEEPYYPTGPIDYFHDAFPMPEPQRYPVALSLFTAEIIHEEIPEVIPQEQTPEETPEEPANESADELMDETPPPDETPEDKATSRKLKFAGICRLKDETLERLYNLDRLSDEELASVGLTRKSLIDDYRHLHELSMLREREQEKRRPVAPQTQRPSRSRLPQYRAREVRPVKTYKFQLLNQLVKVMNTEIDPLTIFREQQFEFDADYYEDETVARMPAKEREKRRFESFCDHLDNMFISGDRNMAIDMVVDALIRLNKRRKQLSIAASQGSRLRA